MRTWSPELCGPLATGPAGSHGMIFMPWVRKECEKPTARERCRGYQLAGQKRAADNSNHWNVKELENLSQCSHFSHFEG
jgi:hypothetical protein